MGGRGGVRITGGGSTRRLALLVLAASIIAALLGPLPGDAAPGQVTVEPAILCTWAFADANGDPVDGVQYGPDADTTEVASAGGTPCTYDVAAGAVTMAPAATHIVDIAPRVLEGHGAVVELWAAVDHPAGPVTDAPDGAVSWQLVGPDGSVRVIDHHTSSCGGDTAPGPAWDWASTADLASGVLGASAIVNADGNGLWEQCRQAQVDIVQGTAFLEPEARCGAWTIETSVVAYGTTTSMSHTFDVACVVAVSLDAAAISWGSIARSSGGVVVGDMDPTTGDAPTVTNVGNVDIELGVEFSLMTNVETGDVIDLFGAGLHVSQGVSVESDPFPADRVEWLVPVPAEGEPEPDAALVCASASAALDLHVFPLATVTDGSYEGSVAVVARAGGLCEDGS